MFVPFITSCMMFCPFVDCVDAFDLLISLFMFVSQARYEDCNTCIFSSQIRTGLPRILLRRFDNSASPTKVGANCQLLYRTDSPPKTIHSEFEEEIKRSGQVCRRAQTIRSACYLGVRCLSDGRTVCTTCRVWIIACAPSTKAIFVPRFPFGPHNATA